MPSKKRPLEDRWSARWFDFDTVFAKTKEKDSLLNWTGFTIYLLGRDIVAI